MLLRLWLAKVGDGEDFGQCHFFAVSVDFALDLEGGATVALEFAEFLQCSEFDESFHLREPGGVIRVVGPTVLGLEFEGLSAIDLEGGEGIAPESFLFESAFGETVFA